MTCPASKLHSSPRRDFWHAVHCGNFLSHFCETRLSANNSNIQEIRATLTIFLILMVNQTGEDINTLTSTVRMRHRQ